MSNFKFIFILIFFSSYLLNYTSFLYTESFILFLAFTTVFIYALQKTSYRISYSKDDFKWNEVILFYIAFIIEDSH